MLVLGVPLVVPVVILGLVQQLLLLLLLVQKVEVEQQVQRALLAVLERLVFQRLEVLEIQAVLEEQEVQLF